MSCAPPTVEGSAPLCHHARVPDSLTGKLLVASPLIEEATFRRTVVFLCAHGPNGAFGLVINRPTAAPVANHLASWLDVVSSPSVLFQGGPVEASRAFGLGEKRPGAEFGGWMDVGAGIGLIDLAQDVGEAAAGLLGLRIFHGYAGWAAEQLEGEIANDGWFVVDSRVSDLFQPDPSALWREVLRRQSGRAALFANFPASPNVN